MRGVLRENTLVCKVRISPNGSRRGTFTCGIYEILHTPTRRRYVGSSQSVESRIYWHLIMLNKGKHHCTYLQNVWNKYGPSGFKFFLLEACGLDDLDAREQYHMDRNSPYILMNVQPIAGSSRGYKHSESTRKKMSDAAKMIGADPLERYSRSIRARLQHETGRFGSRQYHVSSVVCCNCQCEFIPHQTPTGLRSQSKYCKQCKPVHKGGRYRLDKSL